MTTDDFGLCAMASARTCPACQPTDMQIPAQFIGHAGSALVQLFSKESFMKVIRLCLPGVMLCLLGINALAASNADHDQVIVERAISEVSALGPVYSYLDIWQSFALDAYCGKSYGVSWMQSLEYGRIYAEQAEARNAVLMEGLRLAGRLKDPSVKKMLGCMADKRCAYQRALKQAPSLAQCVQQRDQMLTYKQTASLLTGGGSLERVILKKAYDAVFQRAGYPPELQRILAARQFESKGIKDNLFTTDDNVAFARDGHDFLSIFAKYHLSRDKGNAFDPVKGEYESGWAFRSRLMAENSLYGDVTTSSLLAFPVGRWKRVRYDPETGEYIAALPLTTTTNLQGQHEQQHLLKIDYFKGSYGEPSIQVLGSYPKCFIDKNSSLRFTDFSGDAAQKLTEQSRLYVLGFLQEPIEIKEETALRIFPVALVSLAANAEGRTMAKTYMCNALSELGLRDNFGALPEGADALLRDPGSNYLYAGDSGSRVGAAFSTRLTAGQQGGVRVEAVAADGAAARGGLAEGDVVLSVNDVEMRHGRMLAAYISTRPVGTTLRMNVQRANMQTVIEMTTEAAAPARSEPVVAPAPPLGGGAVFPYRRP